MAMKMQIEYDIYGCTSYVPKFLMSDEDVISGLKKSHELNLREAGVFGEVTHSLTTSADPEDDCAKLGSSGKRFLKEVEDGN